MSVKHTRVDGSSSPQDLLNRSFDPTGETLVAQLVGTPDGVNYYPAKVASDGTVQTTGGAGGGSVTVTSSALPTGASTSAAQTTGNTSLASIDTKTPAVGQTTMAASSPVTIASDQTKIPVSGDAVSGTSVAIGSNSTLAIDCSNYRSLMFLITPSGANTVFEASNDGSTWASTTAGGFSQVSGGLNAVWPVTARWFRFRTTNATTATVSYTLQTMAGNIVTFPSAQLVSAPTATGAAIPANAFFIGGTNAGTLQAVAVDGSGNLAVNIGATSSNTPADGVATANSTRMLSFEQFFNGASWDRKRGNHAGTTVLASGARTATTASADQTNYNWRGYHFVLSVTVASGTGGLQVQVQGKDSISGNYYNLNNTPTAVTATGTYVFEVQPGSTGTVTGGITQKTDAMIPRTYRVNVVHGDGSSYTYSISTNEGL